MTSCLATTWGLAAALAAFIVVTVRLGMRTGTPMLSYDDIYRTLFAREWSIAPFFFTELLQWLPFPPMATGIAIRLTGEAFWTALAVDVFATVIAICYVHRATAWLFGSVAAWLAASLFALTPWIVFLSLSRYSEPILLAAMAIAVFHWLRWSETGRTWDLSAAAIALGAAVLTRYEAWPLGVALPVHAAIARIRSTRSSAPRNRRPGLSVLWSVLPAALMTIWVAKNLIDYGTPWYGSAQFDATPAGAWTGLGVTGRYLWQLSPLVTVLGLAGAYLHHRRAWLLCGIAAVSLIVPWYTVSLFRVGIAFPVRLLVLPLMLIAPLAGAAVARAVVWKPALVWIAALMVLARCATDLRLEYPGQPLPMTLLGLRLAQTSTIDRFDALYVQSAGRWGYPDEVRVATNFRRPVGVLPIESPGTPWKDTPAEAILILNDGQRRPHADAFVVSRVQDMTAWGICNRATPHDLSVQWLDSRVPRQMKKDSRVGVTVTLRNAGSDVWRPEACGVRLAARWASSGHDVVQDTDPLPLPRAVGPGETLAAGVTIQTPKSSGEYTLAFDLVEARSHGAGITEGALRLPVHVSDH